ncbi:hypothetical protein [Streptomyces sp. NBC_00454]|uniref:hypothetical protein n=1 Tax=Streptomyces sp. NBC_00454 TaxID=2975747 RepID=UPI0032531BAC
MIGHYIAAQEATSPSSMFRLAAMFIPAGAFCVYRAGRLKLAPRGGTTGMTLARRFVLIGGWFVAGFGALALITGIGLAATT